MTRKTNLVYFLYDESEILYIGTTTKGLERIKQHQYGKIIPFTRYTFFAFKSELDAKNFELEAISLCLPQYNRLKCEHNFMTARQIKRHLKKVSAVWTSRRGKQFPTVFSLEQANIVAEFFFILLHFFPQWLQGETKEKYFDKWLNV